MKIFILDYISYVFTAYKTQLGSPNEAYLRLVGSPTEADLPLVESPSEAD